MKETSLKYCAECLVDFEENQIVYFSWLENRCFCFKCRNTLNIADFEPRYVPEKDVDHDETRGY